MPPRAPDNPEIRLKMYAELVRSKVCGRCSKRKRASEFYNSAKNGGQSLRYLCRVCERERHAEYVNENKERINEYRRKRYHANKIPNVDQGLRYRYGIDLVQYEEMLKEQGDRCAICRNHKSKFRKRMHVDHCHDSKKVRGILCIRCNRAIGLLMHNHQFALSAAKYLKDKN